MKLHTRDFGEVEIDEKDIVVFASPIYGFEQYRKFVFLYQEEVSRHFIWLQSVEEEELSFILVDPCLVTECYSPNLPAGVEETIGDGEYMCWLMASIREPFERSTVNLKSPIVVNSEQRLAAQLILDEDLPIRYPLFREEGENADSN